MIYIVARTPAIAHNVAMRLELKRDQWRCVDSEYDLQGVGQGITVFLVEGFDVHPRANRIMTALHYLKAWTWRENDLGR